jgi:putative membrane protein
MKSAVRVVRPFVSAALLVAAAVTVASAATSTKPAPLTDANIAAIVLAANTIDIDNGKLAQQKSTNESVKAFAQMMITDHTSVNDKAKALAGKLSLTPVPNTASKNLVKSMNSKRSALAKHTGAAFDKAYLDNEIAYHQAVINMLDQQLIPGATNAELKDLLTSVRPAFDAHLAHAKETRAALKD